MACERNAPVTDSTASTGSRGVNPGVTVGGVTSSTSTRAPSRPSWWASCTAVLIVSCASREKRVTCASVCALSSPRCAAWKIWAALAASPRAAAASIRATAASRSASMRR